MPLNEIEDDETKKPIVRHEEVVVPLYKFKEIEKEVKIIKEIQVEGVTKKELFSLIDQMKKELQGLYEMILQLVRYQIKEQEIVSHVVVKKNVEVINPVLKDKEVINPILVNTPIDKPVYYEKRIAEISQVDLDLIAQYKAELHKVYDLLQKIRTYKIQEDVIRQEKQIFVPKRVEVPSEKVVLVVKEEIIESLEELVQKLKTKE